MLLEPANCVTDGLLTLVAFSLAVTALRWERGKRYWTAALGAAGTGALLGTIYHGGLKANGALGRPSWIVITLLVAVTISFLLAGTVATLLGEGRARFWLWLRLGGVTAYAIAAASGHAGLGTLVLTESVTMTAILVLWWRAWRRGLPGAGTVMLAMVASAVGGVVRILPIAFSLGWAFDGTSLYHLMQIPGLALLYIGARQSFVLRAAAGEAVATESPGARATLPQAR